MLSRTAASRPRFFQVGNTVRHRALPREDNPVSTPHASGSDVKSIMQLPSAAFSTALTTERKLPEP